MNIYKDSIKNADRLPHLPGMQALYAMLEPAYSVLSSVRGEAAHSRPTTIVTEPEVHAADEFVKVLFLKPPPPPPPPPQSTPPDQSLHKSRESYFFSHYPVISHHYLLVSNASLFLSSTIVEDVSDPYLGWSRFGTSLIASSGPTVSLKDVQSTPCKISQV